MEKCTFFFVTNKGLLIFKGVTSHAMEVLGCHEAGLSFGWLSADRLNVEYCLFDEIWQDFKNLKKIK